jgi:hypothetical protein
MRLRLTVAAPPPELPITTTVIYVFINFFKLYNDVTVLWIQFCIERQIVDG